MTNLKIVFVSGNFNVLHPGHLRLFRFACELGDRLVVGVHSDRLAGEAAHVPQDLRLEGVKANSYVDHSHGLGFGAFSIVLFKFDVEMLVLVELE